MLYDNPLWQLMWSGVFFLFLSSNNVTDYQGGYAIWVVGLIKHDANLLCRSAFELRSQFKYFWKIRMRGQFMLNYRLFLYTCHSVSLLHFRAMEWKGEELIILLLCLRVIAVIVEYIIIFLFLRCVVVITFCFNIIDVKRGHACFCLIVLCQNKLGLIIFSVLRKCDYLCCTSLFVKLR